MKLTNFFVATTVVIAATLNFGAQGFPQLDINLGSTKILSFDPLGILFGRPTKPTPTAAPIFTSPSPIVTPSPPTQSIVVNPPPVPTTARPDVALCAQNCKFQGTPEYNPVCGSNGIMYNNPGQLICARNCGIDVTQFRSGPCSSPPATVAPNPPTPAPATAQPDITLCIRRCAGTPEYNPVCGSDGIVYNNPGMLTCVINCGINVAQLHSGRCSAPTPRPESSTIVPMPSAVTPKAPTPAPTAIPLEAFICAQNCMLTQEYNPVCGSDGLTYRNVELLICTRNCGINVTQRSYGRCIVEENFSIDPRNGSV